ncbi:MAG: hypothetical protein WCA17_00385, partial [Burkholderiales bacterium]
MRSAEGVAPLRKVREIMWLPFARECRIAGYAVFGFAPEWREAFTGKLLPAAAGSNLQGGRVPERVPAPAAYLSRRRSSPLP